MMLQDLVAGYKIRCNNHSELMETLKQVKGKNQKLNYRLGAAPKKNLIFW